MPEQTLTDHMLTELARRQEEHHRLVQAAEEAQATAIQAQDVAQTAIRASQAAGAEVKRMQNALSALGFGPERQDPNNRQNTRERTTP